MAEWSNLRQTAESILRPFVAHITISPVRYAHKSFNSTTSPIQSVKTDPITSNAPPKWQAVLWVFT